MASQDVFQRDSDGRVIVYIDGCCLNNDNKDKPKRGGIGVYFGPNNKWNFSGPVKGKVTNNIAEIQAAIKAVLICRNAGVTKVLIKTDSEQVSEAMNVWLEGWLKNDWVTTDHKTGKPKIDEETGEPKRVANEEEYKKLLEASKGMDVKYVHVEGHAKRGSSGTDSADKIGNDAAHNLANKGAENATERKD